MSSDQSDHEAGKDQDDNQEFCKNNKVIKHIKNDFFGFLKGKSVEQRKICVLNIYKYFFKFTFEKLRSYVDDPLLMMFTL